MPEDLINIASAAVSLSTADVAKQAMESIGGCIECTSHAGGIGMLGH